jgi:hypothetical protein
LDFSRNSGGERNTENKFSYRLQYLVPNINARSGRFGERFTFAFDPAGLAKNGRPLVGAAPDGLGGAADPTPRPHEIFIPGA